MKTRNLLSRNLLSRNLLFCAFLAVPFGTCWGQAEALTETPPAAVTEEATEGAAGGPEAASATTLSPEYLAQLDGRLQTLEDKLDLLIAMQPRGSEPHFSRLTTRLSSEFRNINQRLERLQRVIDQMRSNSRR